ncbi:Predicted NAD/FAD-binding protein [Cohaesibacter sp. ES.047]|uniref:NAD(P)/FAD-dependent oxidoreductase n=1 Tax=Cohaesibacter sp. ES.047 TaxID=1798205 RepID=UPI000BB794D3|nr:FAD-dependent oxidoreductase [Cohaesibacter sp. ES.047]SNY94240.1 Predicted NAD/FAD-binding protein [Cohaesibacter sp. ES.047]
MHIAVIGSGIAGLSAAWLLSKSHQVDIYEKDDRLGGHANSQLVETDSGPLDVDTGFIVYNERTYPNLTALFDHIGLETASSDMSFAASLDDGRQEYSPQGLNSLFAKPSNLANPRFLKMLYEVRRFYTEAQRDVMDPNVERMTLGDYLTSRNYSKTFIKEHLVPMGAAIWCIPSEQMLAFPFLAFMRFSINHGLVQFRDRPQWRSIPGGSRRYVEKLKDGISGEIHLNQSVSDMVRRPGSVTIKTRQGIEARYDHVVLACHSDQALQILTAGSSDISEEERNLLTAIPYQRNLAILHKDPALMPKRRAAWASWNYMQTSAPTNEESGSSLCVTYWMNRLQNLACKDNLFVTLNPTKMPEEGTVLRSCLYHHPVFSIEAMEAQRHLWGLQGHRRTWFCGAYFGYGFHEDGIQAGLAVAEQLGGVSRPWSVEAPSGRIMLSPDQPRMAPYASTVAAE